MNNSATYLEYRLKHFLKFWFKFSVWRNWFWRLSWKAHSNLRVLGDSHGALFGHNCRKEGSIKVTYGTGSSVMLNTGNIPIFSKHGLSTSLAWVIDGKASYVLEGNITIPVRLFHGLKMLLDWFSLRKKRLSCQKGQTQW